MLLKLVTVVATLAASTNKDAEPRRAVVTQEYWDNTYQVHVSPEHYRHGKLVIPDKKKCPWNVELDVLDASEAERLFENVPHLRELQVTCRKAVADVGDQGYEINAAKVGGYSTIGVTTSIKNDEIQQSYTLQKRIGWSCEVDYAGSPRFKPAVELLFDPNADIIINWDCGVVPAELANKAEGTAWFRQVIVLGKENSEKCLQMPIGRIPRWGLSETQRKGISEYGPDHYLTELLDMDNGEVFGFYPPPEIGKMDPEAAARHVQLINAGLLAHGHAKLGKQGIGFQKGHRFGVKFTTEYWNSDATIAKRYGGFFMLTANVAYYCGSLDGEDQDECIPEWMSEAGVVTKRTLSKPQFKAPFKFPDGSCHVLGVNWRMTVGIGSGHNLNRYVFDVDCVGKGQGEITAHALCVKLGLFDENEVPPSWPYRDAEVMFGKKALKPWPRGFTLKGRFAKINKGDEFVVDGTTWVVFGEKMMRVSAGESARPHKTRSVKVVYYYKKGTCPEPTEATCINVYSKVCKNSKTDEVLKWLQASREQEARSKKRGRVLAYGGGALTLVALNAWLKRREDGEDGEDGEDDEEVGAQRRLRPRSGEHEE